MHDEKNDTKQNVMSNRKEKSDKSVMQNVKKVFFYSHNTT